MGHAAWFGVGAYVTVMLLRLAGLGPWWGLPAGMAAAALLAVAVGALTFRLRGPYFVLGSIAVAEIIRLAALHFSGFTRGAEGFLVTGLQPVRLLGLQLFPGRRPFWYLTLLLALVALCDQPGRAPLPARLSGCRPSARTRTPRRRWASR
ncbi:MAG: hypothetical protein QM767_05070 [Anaeromyxobacter sp.]